MKRPLLNKKGSSLIMVLGAMLILTAVGVLVILMSSSNIRMSSKYNRWSSEYYDLDYAAQERLIGFDSATLVPAEEMARYYLQNNYFTYETVEDFPDGEGMPNTIKTSLSASNLQGILFDKQREAAELLTANETDPSADPQGDYDAAIKELAKQAFDILFYLRVDQLTNENVSDEPLTASNGIQTLCQLNTSPSWFPTFLSSNLEAELTAMTKPQIKVTAFEPITNELPKKVTVLATLKSPGYELSPQTRYVPLKINPLYTNAISAGGSVTFSGGNVSILGDVVSGNNGLSKGLTENNDSGVISINGADVTIRGNLYSAGDIHVKDNGGSISVREYEATFDRSLKDRLYQNEYYYYGQSASPGWAFWESTVEENHTDYIAFIYKDFQGGNAYCNSLAVEPGVISGRLSVEGDLWTQDDIQNDGGSNQAVIDVGGSYIGMSSSAGGTGDPNASSAVINNGVLSGATIEIAGNYIIPGTAFYIFDGGKGSSPGHTVAYYQTAESGSARTIESFTAYLAKEGESSTTYFADPSGDESYIMYGTDSTTLAQKAAHFEANFPNTASNINVRDNASYYSLGVVVDTDGTIRYDDQSVKYKANEDNFKAAQPVLETIFKSKTQYFGTPPIDYNNAFNLLLNGSFGVPDEGRGFYYYNGTYYLSVTGTMEGVIYADGDLIISGGGTIKGAVICRGNLTVSDGVDIEHDKDVILGVLGVSAGSNIIPENSGSRIARRFFSPTVPLTMGEDLATEQIETVSVNAGERMSMAVDRYTIDAWRESRS